MQHNEIDWIFLDTLIWAAVIDYKEAMGTGLGTGQVNWAYVLAKGDIAKTVGLRIGGGILVATTRYVLLPGAILLLWTTGAQTSATVLASAYIAYLAFRLLSWPSRRARRQNHAQQYMRVLDRFERLSEAYLVCTPPIISPELLRHALLRARDAGALFEPGLVALLEVVSARDGPVFLPRLHENTARYTF
jgi:hypothetical protein